MIRLRGPSGSLALPQPYNLLGTTGRTWPYQGPEDHPILAQRLKQGARSLEDVLNGKARKDKQSVPVFIASSGPGVGKSRMLQEFPRLLLDACVDCPCLKTRLNDKVVVNVTLENGTLIQEGETSQTVIGRRILYQLQQPQQSFSAVPGRKLDEMITTLAGLALKDPESLTLILCVDGMQALGGLKDPSGMFASTLRNLCQAMLDHKSFVVVCCSATVYGPVETALYQSGSNQYRIYLPVPCLNPRRIPALDNLTTVQQVLVSDMGGHGRALEILADVLHSTADLPLSKALDSVVDSLKNHYAAPRHFVSKTLLQLVLARKFVLRSSPVDDFVVEDVLECGLFCLVDRTGAAVEDNGVLQVPLVWFLLLARLTSDPLISCFQHHGEVLDASATSTWRPSMFYWQHWEEFNALFRTWKSAVFAGEAVSWCDLHSGATFGSDVAAKVKVNKATVHQASKRTVTSTESTTRSLVPVEDGRVDLRASDAVVLNAAGAPFGDAFMGLIMDASEEQCNEVWQMKLFHPLNGGTITEPLLTRERQKGAASKDFFVVAGSSKSEVLPSCIPPRTAIISEENFEEYYGPFAGRAFHFMPGFVNLNAVTRSVLRSVPHVGDVFAGVILDTIQKSGPFLTFEAFEEATRGLKLSRPARASLLAKASNWKFEACTPF